MAMVVEAIGTTTIANWIDSIAAIATTTTTTTTKNHSTGTN